MHCKDCDFTENKWRVNPGYVKEHWTKKPLNKDQGYKLLPVESNQEVPTNKRVKCVLGYKTNPQTKEATVNVLASGGEVCEKNKFKNEIRRQRTLDMRLGLLALRFVEMAKKDTPRTHLTHGEKEELTT